MTPIENTQINSLKEEPPPQNRSHHRKYEHRCFTVARSLRRRIAKDGVAKTNRSRAVLSRNWEASDFLLLFRNERADEAVKTTSLHVFPFIV